MNRLSIMALTLCFLGALGGPALAQKVRVGEYVAQQIETNHPYTGSGAAQPELVRTDVVAYKDATFISVHFEVFDLAPGDYVVVKSPDGRQSRTYTGLGRANLGRSDEGFFARHVRGDIALVELYGAGNETGYGYKIDFFGRGYSDEEIQELWDLGLGEELGLPEPPGNNRSLCTADDTREAKCYQVSEPTAYEESRSVTRLLISGTFFCTGWLVGCEGHVMTNEHCIADQNAASNTDFEFMAEGADCSTDCTTGLGCPGVIEADTSTLVAVNNPLDYALVLPDSATDLNATYGYMQLRDTGAVLDERIYMPQHPAGWGKRIAMESTYPADVDGFPHASSLTEVTCSGGPPEVGYWADTRGGSSGSPVLGYDDHLVIALHHCRGANFCSSGNPGNDDMNRGMHITAVITDLDTLLPDCAIGSSCPPMDPPTGLEATLNGDNNIDVTWNAAAGAAGYNVYRAESDCPGSNYTLVASGVTGTHFEDTNVSIGTTYAYVAAAGDGACESGQSNCDSAMPITIPPFGFNLWHNDALFHPFYDANANGTIDAGDLVDWLNQP